MAENHVATTPIPRPIQEALVNIDLGRAPRWFSFPRRSKFYSTWTPGIYNCDTAFNSGKMPYIESYGEKQGRIHPNNLNPITSGGVGISCSLGKKLLFIPNRSNSLWGVYSAPGEKGLLFLLRFTRSFGKVNKRPL